MCRFDARQHSAKRVTECASTSCLYAFLDQGHISRAHDPSFRMRPQTHATSRFDFVAQPGWRENLQSPRPTMTSLALSQRSRWRMLRELMTGPRKFDEIMEKLEIIVNEMMADDGPVPMDLGNVGAYDAKTT